MKRGLVNYRWSLILPDQIAEWDAITGWEEERLASMEQHLRPGMVLADIGTEHGWLTAVYGGFVGHANVCMFEPSPEMWVNIRKTWEANGFPRPRSVYVGHVGAKSNVVSPDFDATLIDGWPACSLSEVETLAMPYRYLHRPEDAMVTPATTIDEWSARTGIIPDALTIDVEGAEHEVLRGARNVLGERHPLIWTSIHPDLLARDYDACFGDVHRLMTMAGYEAEFVARDHEEHWLWT